MNNSLSGNRLPNGDYNPLLAVNGLPLFSSIKPEHVEPAIDYVLETNRKRLQEILGGLGEQDSTVENFLLPFDEMENWLAQTWSPVAHLNAVVNSDSLRNSYNACLPKLSEYNTWLGQHRGLYEAYRSLSEGPYSEALTVTQKKSVDNALRDFRLSGFDLSDDAKRRFGEIKKRLSKLESAFSENVLDATGAWTRLIGDKGELSGLPETSLAAARQLAQGKQQEGYLLTLDTPCYVAVVTYCDNRELREEVYRAYTTRASEQGPGAAEFDNTPLMDEILFLRSEMAQLLGFRNYAELSIEKKMATSTEQVMGFLEDLAEKSRLAAKEEFAELQSFAKEKFGVDTLAAWDIAYYSEKLKHQKYAVSQEELRPWFPLETVIRGMFEVAEKLFGISFELDAEVDLWHSDARFYKVIDQGRQIAGFYLDVYARENKRGGAWMDECKVRRRDAGGHLTLPIAYLTCNFNGPVGDAPALLTHNEVTTLFHEFGHGLHHMLTLVEDKDVSGINGVPWDAVELPSQFMENWCWEKEAVPLMSGHYKTGGPLPGEMLGKMLAAKNFQTAMQMVRQLEFAIFDFKIHLEYEKGVNIHSCLEQVREHVAVFTPPGFNRFECGFSHVFAGGYAAGYYSYKWAEVLSADAYSRFEETGIFDEATGASFKEHILEKGGGQDPMDLFVAFRGREPTSDALLKHSGLL